MDYLMAFVGFLLIANIVFIRLIFDLCYTIKRLRRERERLEEQLEASEYPNSKKQIVFNEEGGYSIVESEN
jgi:hypothetical protein